MKIIIESKIPYIKGILEDVAEVEYISPDAFYPERIKDADALIIRTRTYCDKSLLENSKCKFIGTATIGMDHIDAQYCSNKGITVRNAPGCNAPGVAQYVWATIASWMNKNSIPFDDVKSLTLGIVGVGHVGSIVEKWARNIGIKVLLSDPPRERNEKNKEFVSLSQIAAESDIITFHTPLNREGSDATYHLCDSGFIDTLKRKPLIINSARGAILDTQALVEALNIGKIRDVAIDCWENEPEINRDLLERAFIATPHIAGYSEQGKRRASAMMIEAINEYFDVNLHIPHIDKPKDGADNVTLTGILGSYDPLKDTNILKESPQAFENQRNLYDYRSEV